MNWEKDELISNLKGKLTRGEQLNESEISSVVSALIKAKGYTQKPYFEIVYHDKFDRKERSIMQPEYSKIIHEDGFIRVKQRFSVEINRIVSEEEMEEFENIHDGM
ncbi:MAG: hypothetical protein J6S85_17400 [Methanobrevibacter sp.]|nr:hypothetical protein [Methanobrevibacter sp.]